MASWQENAAPNCRRIITVVSLAHQSGQPYVTASRLKPIFVVIAVSRPCIFLMGWSSLPLSEWGCEIDLLRHYDDVQIRLLCTCKPSGTGQTGGLCGGRRSDWRVLSVLLGSGQFCPSAAANPYLGQPETLETVTEYRVELVSADDHIRAVLAALRLAHPYEEPAFDLVRLVDEAELP